MCACMRACVHSCALACVPACLPPCLRVLPVCVLPARACMCVCLFVCVYRACVRGHMRTCERTCMHACGMSHLICRADAARFEATALILDTWFIFESVHYNKSASKGLSNVLARAV
jgi:hypothetical protein